MKSYSLVIQTCLLVGGGLFPGLLSAQNGLRFHDIAAGDGAGITYRRTPSARHVHWEALRNQAQFTLPDDAIKSPLKSRGAPGVALLDYDGDGDLDLYVTNGPGSPNSLYANQVSETGETRFVDVAEAAGVAATAQDSSGVCFGDLDNDGDHDLYVLGYGEANILYRNNGDGSFTDITGEAGAAGGENHTTAASMGDVNGDGLLDIYVGNLAPSDDFTAILVEPVALNQHNQLLLNQGDLRFDEVGAQAGIRDLDGFPDEMVGSAGLTWAVGMADYDLDGDIDIFSADDQGGYPFKFDGGIDRGLVRIFQNDGSGFFTDVTNRVNPDHPGAWMGLTFGDYNADGHLDFFGTNFGNFAPNQPEPSVATTRWFLGSADGNFSAPHTGFNGTPFGWGASSADYDNDGDTDIIYHGGFVDATVVELSNPGAVLQNDGLGNFSYDQDALSESTDHSRRVVHGMAVGDLDLDGFVDIVSVSNVNVPVEVGLFTRNPLNSPFDPTAFGLAVYLRTADPNIMVYNQDIPPLPDGTLAVELNSGDNGNGWAAFRLVGAKGLTSSGQSNRDGIGAVLSFTPEGGRTAIVPVVGGSSYASQDSVQLVFGMGTASSGTVEVLWPGGARNKLYDVRPGETILVPELPSFANEEIGFYTYFLAVKEALGELTETQILTEPESVRLRASSLKAFLEHRYPNLFQ